MNFLWNVRWNHLSISDRKREYMSYLGHLNLWIWEQKYKTNNTDSNIDYSIVSCSTMIWYDMIWYDMIWYDMIWYSIYSRCLLQSFENLPKYRQVIPTCSVEGDVCDLFLWSPAFMGCIWVSECGKHCISTPNPETLGALHLHPPQAQIHPIKQGI